MNLPCEGNALRAPFAHERPRAESASSRSPPKRTRDSQPADRPCHGPSQLLYDPLNDSNNEDIGERTHFSANITRQGKEPARTTLVSEERPCVGKWLPPKEPEEGSRAIFAASDWNRRRNSDHVRTDLRPSAALTQLRTESTPVLAVAGIDVGLDQRPLVYYRTGYATE